MAPFKKSLKWQKQQDFIYMNEITKSRPLNLWVGQKKLFQKIDDVSIFWGKTKIADFCWCKQFFKNFFFWIERYLRILPPCQIWAHLNKDSRNYKHFKFLTSKISVISMATETKIRQIIKLVTASCSTPFLEEIFTDLCSSY